MFIKVTLQRLDDKEKDVLFPSLLNMDDVKGFHLDTANNKVHILYKTYNDIGEESDQVQEDMKTISERLKLANLYILQL